MPARGGPHASRGTHGSGRSVAAAPLRGFPPDELGRRLGFRGRSRAPTAADEHVRRTLQIVEARRRADLGRQRAELGSKACPRVRRRITHASPGPRPRRALTVSQSGSRMFLRDGIGASRYAGQRWMGRRPKPRGEAPRASADMHRLPVRQGIAEVASDSMTSAHSVSGARCSLVPGVPTRSRPNRADRSRAPRGASRCPDGRGASSRAKDPSTPRGRRVRPGHVRTSPPVHVVTSSPIVTAGASRGGTSTVRGSPMRSPEAPDGQNTCEADVSHPRRDPGVARAAPRGHPSRPSSR
jgi:hypothetical protein